MKFRERSTVALPPLSDTLLQRSSAAIVLCATPLCNTNYNGCRTLPPGPLLLSRAREGQFLREAAFGRLMARQNADFAQTPYQHKNPMRRHWCITLWNDATATRFADANGVVPLSDWLTAAIDTARLLRATYIAWGLEDKRRGGMGEHPSASAEADDSDEADFGLHMHLYIECERSVRWTTVRNKFQTAFHGAHVEPRRGWRTSAREYAVGLRNGIPKPEAITAGEMGEFRPETPDQLPDDISAEAANMVMQGCTPKEVATKFPRWFLRHGFGVIRLWETLHHRKWLK